MLLPRQQTVFVYMAVYAVCVKESVCDLVIQTKKGLHSCHMCARIHSCTHIHMALQRFCVLKRVFCALNKVLKNNQRMFKL